MTLDDESGKPLKSHDSNSRWHTRSSMIASLQGFSEKRWTEFELVYRPLLSKLIEKSKVPQHARDDVLQETLISIMKGIGKFERSPGKSFRGWLKTIIQRRSADYFRSLPKDRAGKQELLDLEVEPVQKDPSLLEEEERAMLEVKARALELVRSQTQPQTWEMFWKSTQEEIPTSEIAAEFGVSMAAVRMAKQRVSKRLREVLFEG